MISSKHHDIYKYLKNKLHNLYMHYIYTYGVAIIVTLPPHSFSSNVYSILPPTYSAHILLYL